MIKVNIKRNNGLIESIKCHGHAGYDDYGKDIVCASFSTMIITTINAILEIDKDAISYTDTNNLEIINLNDNNNILFINASGYELPETGSSSTLILIIIGYLLLIGPIIYIGYDIYKKKGKADFLSK